MTWSNQMTFRDYIELLFQAYLQDKKYLVTLRQKIKTSEFNKEQMYDPAFSDWKGINPINPDTHQSQRIKFHPNPLNPEDGIYVDEDKDHSKFKLGFIKQIIRKQRMAIQIKNIKSIELINEILKRTSYSNPISYLEDRIKSDYEAVIKNKKLTIK